MVAIYLYHWFPYSANYLTYYTLEIAIGTSSIVISLTTYDACWCFPYGNKLRKSLFHNLIKFEIGLV